MSAVLKQATPKPDPKAKAWAVARAGSASDENKELTDAGNAGRFAEKFGGALAFIPARGQWLEFINHAWHADALGRCTQHAISATRDMMGDAAKLAIEAMQANDPARQAGLATRAETLLQHARKSQQKPRLDAMVSLASTDPRLAVDQSKLDHDDLSLGVENGVLEMGDVSTFRPGQPGDLITRKAGSEWQGGDAPCPMFEAFLEQIQPDPDVRHWLQKFVGYCLTGKTSEQVFVVMHGHGANGKSVFVEVLKRLMGSYSHTVQFSTFMERDQNAIRNDLASLDKARLVVASEGQEGARLDEGLVKQITGEDAITARFLHREFFTYQPRFKVVLVTNHKPVISGTDHGIWRRVVLVPFPTTIARAQQDKQLLDKLAAELPGILAWSIDGFHKWREQGLGDLPNALILANSEYRQNSDILGMWLDDRCWVDTSPLKGLFSTSAELYKSYEGWALDHGHRPMSSTSLGNRLRERGLTQSKERGGRGWRGIALKSPTRY